ncbi:MAG: hypothetical protein JSW68_13110 [Burkholderiales bacterium]|nr:MAG: hypothetical protein JSW68_13110 [Burkholderiales bacterium]
MQVVKLPAGTGWRWVGGGFALLRRQPLAVIALTFLFLMALSLTTLLGGFMPLALAPLFSVGLMHVLRAVDSGQPATPALLIRQFQDDGGSAWKRLLVLGAINLLVTLGVLALAALADGGALMRLITGGLELDDPALADGSMLTAAIVFLVAYTPVQMAMWYAPLFTAWHGVSPPKALFFSLVAVWRNRWAFVVYILGWFGILLAATLTLRMIGGLLAADSMVLSLLVSPISLLLVTALYASFWPTYRDAVRDAGPGAVARAG